MSPVLEIQNVSKTFVLRRNLLGRAVERLRAVNDVSLTVEPGRTVGLVGESGSGKSTLARIVMSLIKPDNGQVVIHGKNMTVLSGRQLREARRSAHMVFQDPRSSLDPNWLAGDIIAEPLCTQTDLSRAERATRVRQLLLDVGLREDDADRYAYEFSGGQRQRIAIARALAPEPALVVCDEPVSALDVSTQAQILDLLRTLQDRLGVAYLLISHDLSVIRHISHDIAVMYFGSIVELGKAEDVCEHPEHPYTEALISAVPRLSRKFRKERILLCGDPTRAGATPSGCSFANRCSYAVSLCHETVPDLEMAGCRSVACHLRPHAVE